MATHSSIVAWEIPWTEESGGLVCGVTKVRHDLVTKPPPPSVSMLEIFLNTFIKLTDD